MRTVRLSPGPLHLRALLISVLIWSALAIAMAIARGLDAEAHGAALAIAGRVASALPYFVPLMLFNWGLHVAFLRWPRLSANAGSIAALYAGVALLFFPAYVAFEIALEAGPRLFERGAFAELFARQSRVGWWVDLIIVTGAYAAQLGVVSWLRARERERALHRERSDNLQLRLSLLQRQLEPHFLFNSLNSVSALVRSGERGEALTALTELSDVIRHALRASRSPWVSMADEIRFIDCYLRLQQLRHGDRMQIVVEISESDWEECACAPLLVQPLIENAFKHGLEQTSGAGKVQLRLGECAGQIQFWIENSIDPDAPYATDAVGVGLAVTRDRLAALYGARATLHTECVPGRFVATLAFPFEAIDDKLVGIDR